MSETYEELQNLSRDELIKRHDRNSKYTQVGISHYLAELRHRETLAVQSAIAKNLRVIAKYCLARWKAEARGGSVVLEPPAEELE